jgi:hypothetical protein
MAAIRIIQPASGHIQLPVDHGVAGIAGVQELDGDLGVLDAAGGAGVLALQPNRLHVHELRVDQQSTTAGPRPLLAVALAPTLTALPMMTSW